MQTKHQCVHIWTKGEVGAPWNRFKPSSKIFNWPFQGGAFFVDHLCYFCLVFVMLSCASVYWCLVVTCWERDDLLALVCDVWMWSCHFPIGILGPVWCLIVSISDICPLSYFKLHYLHCKPRFLTYIKYDHDRSPSMFRLLLHVPWLDQSVIEMSLFYGVTQVGALEGLK